MAEVSIWSWVNVVLPVANLGLGLWSVYNLRRVRKLKTSGPRDIEARAAIAIAVLDQPWPAGDDRWTSAVQEALKILRSGARSLPSTEQVARPGN